tara:strand:- start:1593 stop:2075 length:483 start_codon:yes stop_codon:yes gene_type:complete
MTKFILATLLFTSIKVNAHSCNSLNELTWLLGEWQSQKQQSATTERWTKLTGQTFEGTGKTANNYESLRLLEMSGEIFYLAKVAHNPVPVGFKLIQCDNKRFIFKNSQHDFPNTIEYQQISPDTMQIKVSGKAEKTFTIQLYRVQNKTSDTKEKQLQTWP